MIIIAFFILHWQLSVFSQTFFLHRYGAHRMFTMSKGRERFFYLCTFVFQGSSFLNPRAYAILHREHHAYSDTPRDPHSPHTYPTLWTMMLRTKARFDGLAHGTITSEPRFEGGAPEWPLVDRLGMRWTTHVVFIALYIAFYVHFAPHWLFFRLLPIHFVMGPVHGSLVNWCGQKYGYRNFRSSPTDRSRNALPFDFLTFGELFQNNHHTYPMAPNFAARWFEIDPTWSVIRLFAALGIVRLPARVQIVQYPEPVMSGGAVLANSA